MWEDAVARSTIDGHEYGMGLFRLARTGSAAVAGWTLDLRVRTVSHASPRASAMIDIREHISAASEVVGLGTTLSGRFLVFFRAWHRAMHHRDSDSIAIE